MSFEGRGWRRAEEQTIAVNSTNEATQSGSRMIEVFICPRRRDLQRRLLMRQDVARVGRSGRIDRDAAALINV